MHRSKRCARLFDHLVGAGEERWRQAEHLGGLEIDKLPFGGLQYRARPLADRSRSCLAVLMLFRDVDICSLFRFQTNRHDVGRSLPDFFIGQYVSRRRHAHAATLAPLGNGLEYIGGISEIAFG